MKKDILSMHFREFSEQKKREDMFVWNGQTYLGIAE